MGADTKESFAQQQTPKSYNFCISAFLHCAKRLHEVSTALNLLEHGLSQS